MTKTLTEQWREGTLPEGAYYILVDKYEQNEPEIDVGVCYNSNFEWWIVKEVIAPVPSYDKIKRLQEQLKEANEVIKEYGKFNNWEGDDKDQHDLSYFVGEDNGCGWEIAKDYLEKWGVK